MEAQRVYLIAPNPLLALDLKRLLRRLGLEEGIRFRTVEDAWLAIQTHPPDVLLWDSSDPKLNDLQDGLLRIRSRFHFPILLISTWTQRELPSSFQQMECTEVLEKPFADWEFLEIMDRFESSE